MVAMTYGPTIHVPHAVSYYEFADTLTRVIFSSVENRMRSDLWLNCYPLNHLANATNNHFVTYEIKIGKPVILCHITITSVHLFFLVSNLLDLEKKSWCYKPSYVRKGTSSAALYLSAGLFNALLNHMLPAAIKNPQKLSLSCLFSSHPASFFSWIPCWNIKPLEKRKSYSPLHFFMWLSNSESL